jgi:hypothetical protein
MEFVRAFQRLETDSPTPSRSRLDVSIHPQTKRCLRVARSLFLDHDLAQHCSSKVLRRFLCPLPCGTPHASRSCSGTGQSAQYDDSSGDTWPICVDIPSCVSYARAHQDSPRNQFLDRLMFVTMITAAKIARSEIHAGLQPQSGHSAARDAKARKATVKIALPAPYSSRMCSTIDLSCPNAGGCGSRPSMATRFDPRLN